LGIEGCLETGPAGVPFHTVGSVLMPVEHQLDGFFNDVRRNQKGSGQDIGKVFLSTEGSTCGGLANDNVLVWPVQQSCDRFANVERTLGTGIHHELVAVGHHECRVGLQVHMFLPPGYDLILENTVCIGEDRIDITLVDGEIAEEVVLPNERTAFAGKSFVDGNGGNLLLI